MRIRSFLLLIILAFFLTGCMTKEEPTLSFENHEFKIYVDEDFTIIPSVENLEDLDLIEYHILEPNIIKYEDGKFIGLKAGNTDIEVTITGYGKIKEIIKVSVFELHQITYELNDGVLINPRESFKKSDLPFYLPIPTREGYVFKGWYNNQDYSGGEVKQLTLDDTKDVELYAKWDKYIPTYSISYILGGGTLDNPTNSFTVENLPITLDTPTRNGYKFLGWYLNSDYNGPIVKEIKAGTESNQRFFARWEKISPIDYSNILVDLSLTDKEEGDFITYNDMIFIVGKTAFTSIQEAISKSTKVIYIAPGTYLESFNINKSNIKIIGPNNRVLPVDKFRSNEAVLMGKIALGDVENISISGFTFKEESQIKSELQVKNFIFEFNIINETPSATSTWTASQTNVESFLSLYNTNADFDKISKNIVIRNNLFSDVSEYNISLARVSDVYITNNIFKNFARDAIRIDGDVNGGKFVVLFNEFSNDVLGGYNGIYFRTYGNDESGSLVQQEIEIHHNIFTNIGREAEHSGAITAHNYQGFGANISIMYNVFEECINYVFLRNFSTAENHTKYNWIANINHNAFKGIPNNYYYKNWSNEEDLITNPNKANFNSNYFEDNDNNPITDLSLYENKISRVASSINHYQSKETYDSYLDAIRTQKPMIFYVKNPIYKMNQYGEYQLLVEFLPKGILDAGVIYSSNNNEIATVSSDGKITALKEGVVVITVKSRVEPSLQETIEINVLKPTYIETSYSGNSALKVGDIRYIECTVHNLPGFENIRWSSSDESVAKVDQNGQVTAVGVGNVIITITGTNSKISASVGFTVYGSEVTNELLKYLIELNRGNLFTKNVTYIGFQGHYKNRIYNTVNTYLAAPKDEIILNMLSTKAPNYDGRTMSVEYITVHDTGSASATSTARANSNWNNNSTNTDSSWHYTVGNDGVFKQIEDNKVALHAGDGTSVAFTRFDTGVKATILKPKITITSDGYYAFNGTKSRIKAPTINGRIAKNTDIAPMGILSIIGDNGNYWMGPTYYNTIYKKISNRGGNLASIGIETAINDGSDVFWTWQKTAKLIAGLLTTHNLTPERVVYHNNFSGKLCPQTMMTAGLVGEFEAMVEAEYNIYKKYSDYTVIFESHNPEIINNSGQVINPPLVTTNVSYTITVKKGSFSQSITLNALVPGQRDWR